MFANSFLLVFSEPRNLADPKSPQFHLVLFHDFVDARVVVLQ
jgi:hypothetical protein